MGLGEPLRRPARRGRAARRLAARISDLGSGFGVSQTFVPSDQNGVDRVHAFRVLAHSEIQDFLEQLAERMLDVTEDHSKKRKKITAAGHHLLVYQALRPLGSPATAATGTYPPFRRAEADAALASLPAAIRAHRKVVSKNSGAKTGNTQMLLVPLGIRPDHCTPGALDQLDALGSARGDVAHASGVVGAAAYPTGSVEWNRLAQILGGLELLEQWVPRLLRPL
jgi:hypothetical protein